MDRSGREGREATHDPDEVALERYRYLLRTAPPEELERAHEEAFASLTPEQRRRLLEGLAREAGPAESQGIDDSPARLARLATRTELRRPGTMERVFGPEQGGRWFGGGGLAGSFLATIAGVVVGTAVANALFVQDGDPLAEGAADASGDPGSTGEADGGSWGDAGTESEPGGWDAGDSGGLDPGDGGGFDLGDGGFDLGGF